MTLKVFKVAMNISRDAIISAAQAQLERNPHILALWLEGADATGHVDSYSDIDLCCSVEAGAMDSVTSQMQAALESLGTLDLTDRSTSQTDFQFSVFHLQDTSPYLLIDFNVFVDRGSQFVEGDEIEKPLVLFDRGGVVKFSKPDERLASIQRNGRLKELADTVSQYSRIEKYIKRKNFLEAFGYYHKWLLTPLIEVLRMRYTPLHADYYIVHISRHLPADVLRKLERLFQISSLADLEAKSREALAFFEETETFLRSAEMG
jgi:hypothetical protein